jgi:hypothetical protein
MYGRGTFIMKSTSLCDGVLRLALFLVLFGIGLEVRAQQTELPVIANIQVTLSVPPPPPHFTASESQNLVLPQPDKFQIPSGLSLEISDLIAGDEPFLPGRNSPSGEGRIDRAPEFPGIDWSNTLTQSLFFLGVMHSYRLVIEPDTRAALTGKFWKDYVNSVKQLRGWSDGDSFMTNYIGHPIMGSIAGRILIQNDPRGRALEPEFNQEYFKSRMKAFGYSFLFSTQFEWGLISEGTIGNATPNQYTRHPFSFIDFVVTPTVGTAWLVGEDMLDKYGIRRIETWTTNRQVRALARTILNPSRAFANMMRLKYPWYRDGRKL